MTFILWSFLKEYIRTVCENEKRLSLHKTSFERRSEIPRALIRSFSFSFFPCCLFFFSSFLRAFAAVFFLLSLSLFCVVVNYLINMRIINPALSFSLSLSFFPRRFRLFNVHLVSACFSASFSCQITLRWSCRWEGRRRRRSRRQIFRRFLLGRSQPAGLTWHPRSSF